jgi:hypothetical protein
MLLPNPRILNHEDAAVTSGSAETQSCEGNFTTECSGYFLLHVANVTSTAESALNQPVTHVADQYILVR